MSTLSQFLPAGDSFVGEMIPGPASIWGGNPTFSGKEYLRTGLLKTYNANYAGLFSALPTACVANGQKLFTNSNWLLYGNGSYGAWGTYFYSANIYDLGGNKHVVYNATCAQNVGITGAVKYGSSFASAPTNAIDLAGDGTNGSAVYSSILFNNAIYAAAYLPASYSSAFTAIFRSTGSSYSASANTAFIDSYYLMASPSRLVALPYNYGHTSHTNSISFTDNGTSWSQATPNIDIRYPQRACWSTVGNRFIIVTHTGNILTSTNGTTWSSATAPANMPTSIAGEPWYPRCVNTASATYIMLTAPTSSSTYILKTTNGTSFTLMDLADSPPLVGLFTGSAGMVPWLLQDGARMILAYSNLQAYSDDDGATWTVDTARFQNVASGYNGIGPTFLYSGGLYIPYSAQTQYGSFTALDVISFAGRSFSATPQFVGATAAQVFATGSNLSTYFRIK